MRRPLIALAFLLTAGPANALTLTSGVRSIFAEFQDASGAVVAAASDSETVRDDAPYTRTLSAFIGGGVFEASVGMSTSGFFGIEAESFRAGRLTTRVTTLETYLNDTAFPIELSASFVVVDGQLHIVSATGGALVLDVATGEFPFGDFTAQARLDSVDFAATYSESGDPLNGAQVAPGSPAFLPFQRQVLDLGRLEPGESFDFFYSLSIVADSDLLEFARWVFVDPSATAGQASPFLITSAPAGPAAVPAPAALPLLLSALAGLAALGRARARRRAAG